jgi:hypothetical protein
MAVHGSVNHESLDCVPSVALVKLPAMNTTCHGLNAPATEKMKTIALSDPKAMVLQQAHTAGIRVDGKGTSPAQERVSRATMSVFREVAGWAILDG